MRKQGTQHRGVAVPAFIGILIVLALLITFWYVALAVVGAYGLMRLFRYIRKERYFASDQFLAHKREISAIVSEHNEIAQYAAEMRDGGSFVLGASATGAQAHLASWENTSHHNYRRDRNVASLQAKHVHNCSLQVVRNASTDPIKYLMKYFNIRAEEATLTQVEELSDSIGRLENAVSNLKQREESITKSIDPPSFILKHYSTEFMERVGVVLPSIDVPYPVYSFEYVSAGGNSAQRTTVTLNSSTIDALIEALGQKIRFAKSAAGQRALMTAKLRSSIKVRDDHTCQNKVCGISLAREAHLLLEVDHVLPVSRGGLSTPENLQTLCWKCNRSKAAKVLV
jgi:hypothetical protein